MSTPIPAYNPAFPSALSPGCAPFPPPPPLDPKAPEAWDYGFQRLVPLLNTPPVGAGILAISFFFLIAFFSNVLIGQVTLATLGIAITLSTLGLLTLVVLILFLF